MKKILLIDDNPDYRDASKEILGDAGYDFWEAPSPKDAFELPSHERFDLILCDLHMPLTADEDQKEYVYSFEVGVRVIQELVSLFPQTPVVALSTISQSDLSRIALYIDPVPAFSKPFQHREYLSLVRELCCDDAVRGVH